MDSTTDNKISENRSGPIGWMVRNPVASNLLMVIIVIGGALSMFRVQQEVFPEFDMDIITVAVPYPGASPPEVEQGVLLAVEEAVGGINGVKRVKSTASEGAGVVTIELLLSADKGKVLTDVKNEVDRISSFPQEAETPIVSTGSRKNAVVSMIISGPFNMRALHLLAEKARNDLLVLPKITLVEVKGVRPLEVSIEVSRENLEAFGLTLSQISAQIKMASVEIPSGALETKGGDILVRLRDRKLKGKDFESIIIRGTKTGQEVTLGEIATIIDGFEETDKSSFFNGDPAVRITTYRVGNATPMEVSTTVKAYAETFRKSLPPSVTLSIWNDDSELLRGRIDLLTRNARLGLILVVIILSLFLKRKFAFWVAVGIPISFLGTFLLMGPLGVSINMITLFALIVTLGMVVDDAIIISENIYDKQKQGLNKIDAAIQGAREMAVPVTFAILTTVVAFAPLMFVPGVMGKIFFLIPVIVITVLAFSLLESFFILPSHLAHGSDSPSRLGKFLEPLDRIQEKISDWLDSIIENKYKPLLIKILNNRYVTLAGAVSLFMVTMSLLISRVVPFQFFPKMEGDIITATARLPYGVAMDRTLEVRKILEEAAQKAIKEVGGKKIVRGVFTQVGQGATPRGPGNPVAETGSHLLSIEVNLVPSDKRDITSEEFAVKWKSHIPPIPGLEALTIGSNFGPSAGKAIDIQLIHRDYLTLSEGAAYLETKLKEFSDLTDFENSYNAGKTQYNFSILPGSQMHGLSSADVGQGLRNSIFGNEAIREQRGRHEIKVMVRLPKNQRESEMDLENLLIGTKTGGSIPFGYLAKFSKGKSPTSIVREDGNRVVNVSAEIKSNGASAGEIISSLKRSIFPEMEKRFSGIQFRFKGMQQEQNESFASLGPNFLLAMFVIFALLAIPFKSYIQPLIVMLAIPFGIVGAIWGHILMGYSLSFISVLGVIALSGVVVNDSLVLVDAVNKYRGAGQSPLEAVINGGMRRFRPILLTSLTTFFGLSPMIFETSMQAKFLIPMAISLGFGTLFATLIALLLVPAFYMIIEDLRNLTNKIYSKEGVIDKIPIKTAEI